MPVIKRRVDKKTPGNKGWWSDRERFQACSAYLIIGNWRLTAAATNIPEETLRRWGIQDWWKEACDEIRKGSKIELNNKISNVIAKTMEQLDDRVSNGDYFFNPKTGKFDRKPINASVASKVAGDLINKSLLLEKEVTAERLTDEGLDDRLKKLRDEMIRFAKAKTIEAIVEGEVSDELFPPLIPDVPQAEEPRPAPSNSSGGSISFGSILTTEPVANDDTDTLLSSY